MADSQGLPGGGGGVAGGSSPATSLGGGAPQPPSRGTNTSLPNSTGRQLLPVPSAAAAAAAAAAPAAPPSLHSNTPKPSSNMIIASGLVSGPRIVILHRYNGDFGFTLRHFIVYPPESLTEHAANPLAAVGMLNFAQPMDTVFVKKVHPNTPAHRAGLQEGDRLLAVNGVPVTSIPYSQVVATIQQTPKTLTLQVVPKNYDILQTFFSETAHNPETNQRPQPQQVYAPKAIMAAGGAYPKTKPNPPTTAAAATNAAAAAAAAAALSVEGVQEKQESLYSTLQEIVSENVGAAKPPADVPKMLTHPGSLPIQAGHHVQKSMVPVTAAKPYDYDSLKQQQYLHLQQQQQQQQYQQKIPDPSVEGSYPPLIDGDSAIMSRLRKSLEQKEEFLRRPTTGAAAIAAASDVQQREFYGRPNRLQKSVWPPSADLPDAQQPAASALTATPSGAQSAAITITTTTKPMVVNSTTIQREHATQLSAIREHFFTSGIGGSLQQPPKSAPPPTLAIAATTAVPIVAGPSSPTGGATVPLSPHSMHAVSEKAKLFESGRPLSPEGIDRMDLYKSELSRINTKQVVPNVAVRRKEFELKAESTGWRKSIEDKPRSVSSDSESRRTPVRLRSLSVESNATRDSRHSLASSTLLSSDPFEPGSQALLEKDLKESVPSPPSSTAQMAPVAMLRQKPIRDDAPPSAVSYRNAVRNSTAFWLQGPPPSVGGEGSGECDPLVPVRPVPPVRTHRLHHPLSAADTEQMRKKMHHRNQTIVELRHFLAGDGDGDAGIVDGTVPAVVMRQKQPHPHPHPGLLLDEEERKMRRISYLRATAHENLFQMLESDADSSPMSLPPADTPEADPEEPGVASSLPVGTQQHVPHQQQQQTGDDAAPSSLSLGKPMQPQQLKSAYRPWRRPRLTTDIQPLLRLFDPEGGHLPPILEIEPPVAATHPPPIAKKRTRTRPIPPRDDDDDDDADADADADDDEDGGVGDEDGMGASHPPPSLYGKLLRTPMTTAAAAAAVAATTTPVGGRSAGAGTGAGNLGNLHVITTTTAGGVVTRSYFFAQSHGTKAKALAHFRDGAADSTEPLVREGELHVKVTLIDGKRSADRSWRTVHAELRGHHLKLALVREGKNSNQVSHS
uniref:PDZ domain-containing protein n=1 Tax=Anopheles farauti TaxID=69004 RepID=A0A182QGE1_9DIPT